MNERINKKKVMYHFLNHVTEIVLILVVIALWISTDSFMKLNNWMNLLRSGAIKGLIALGVTMVLICGKIDLSTGSQVGLSGMFVAVFCKNMVAAGIADEVLIQVSYAIGVAQPVSLFVNTYGTSHVALSDAEIACEIGKIFDLRPKAIEERLKLRQPIYEETAAYGHMGRQPRTVHKTFTSRYEKPVELDVELFTWEKLDYVDTLKKAFSL